MVKMAYYWFLLIGCEQCIISTISSQKIGTFLFSLSCLNVSVWVSASLAQFGVNATSQVLLLVTKGAAPQREGDQVDLLRINQLQAQAQIQRQNKTITAEVAVLWILSVPICAILILLMVVARPVWAEIMCFSCSANWFWSGQMWEGSWSALARNHLLGFLWHCVCSQSHLWSRLLLSLVDTLCTSNMTLSKWTW